ncbi:hypothetical protein ZIOFF_015298 [Zingiber officinale]|uniref:Uncharacterized protein n=1 Tax=Zingiber officinale TaxID=94328 RepID=A0A8J5HIK4_ZINOF|nr:hypothetical protein ZIOFF_015298 [Zingiber officinale]
MERESCSQPRKRRRLTSHGSDCEFSLSISQLRPALKTLRSSVAFSWSRPEQIDINLSDDPKETVLSRRNEDKRIMIWLTNGTSGGRRRRRKKHSGPFPFGMGGIGKICKIVKVDLKFPSKPTISPSAKDLISQAALPGQPLALLCPLDRTIRLITRKMYSIDESAPCSGLHCSTSQSLGRWALSIDLPALPLNCSASWPTLPALFAGILCLLSCSTRSTTVQLALNSQHWVETSPRWQFEIISSGYLDR